MSTLSSPSGGAPPPVAPVPATGSGGAKRWLLAAVAGCGCLVVATLGVIGIVVAAGWYSVSESDSIRVRVEAPAVMTVEAEGDLIVTVENVSGSRSLTIDSIHLATSYLDGLAVLSTDPVPKTVSHQAIFDAVSHDHGVVLEAGQSRAFRWRLRATNAGRHAGDVDVYGTRFLVTQHVTTVVREAPAAPPPADAAPAGAAGP